MTPDDERQLTEVDPELAQIVRDAAVIVPLTVIEGHRGEAAQNKAVAEGKSKLPWPKGKHNRFPSDAVDLAPTYYEKGTKIDWNDLIAFGRIMGVVQCLGHQRGIKLRFGMDWDGDFRSVNRDPDESFLDAPHVERVRDA